MGDRQEDCGLKALTKKTILSFVVIGAICCPMFYAPDAFAGEGSPTWRRIYNDVMLFINFGILVFFFIKFAKTPMMKALGGIRQKIAEEFESINGEKEKTQSLRDVEAQKIKEIETYVEEIKKNILEMGEREKEKIIEEGRLSAEKMVQDAQNYAENRVKTAIKALSDEMVDMAIGIVEEKLLKGVTEEDNERLVEQFVSEIQFSPAQLK